jgi:hypothetical protein
MNTIKFIFLLLTTLFLSGITDYSLAQTAFTAYSPEIGVTACPGSDIDFNAGIYTDLPAGITFSGFTRNVVTCNSASTHYRSAGFTSTSKTNAVSENRYVSWSFAANASVEFDLSEISIRHERSAAGADNGAIYYSVNGAAFSQVGADFTIATTNDRTVLVFTTPISIPSGGSVEFRWYCWRTSTTGSGNVRFKGGADYATGSGIVGTFTPTSTSSANASSNFSTFFYPLADGPSGVQVLTVSGSNLTNPIVVTPPSNYEISTSEVGPFQTTALSVNPVSGNVSSTEVFVRLIAGLTVGNYNDDIVVTSDDANSPQSVAVQGVVFSESLTYFEDFGSVAGQFPLGWTTSGNGAANWTIGTSTASTGSGQANLQDAGSLIGQEAIVTMNRALSTIGTSNVIVSFLARKTGSYSGNVELDFSTDGVSWTNVPFVDVPNTSNWESVSVLLPPAAGNVSNLRLRFRTTRINTSGNYRIDDFTVAAAGPAVNVGASTTTASEDAQTQITITVTLEQAMPADETILLGIAGTNINENDYNLSSTSVTIPAGQTSGSVSLEILDDNLNEGTETMIVNIAGFSSALSPGLNSFVEIEIEDNDDAINLLQIGVANPIIDFNELQNNGTNLFDITRGFYLFEQGDNANSLYRASDGTSDTGDTYSFGNVASNERALGSLSTGPLSPNTFGARLVNTTGQLINGLHVSYTGEQWRVGAGAEDALTFSYSLDATDLSNGTWTEVSALTFNAPVINGSGAALNGNDPANQVNLDFEINNILVLNNGTIWIKWVDENIPSTDHGMAIDDLVLTPIYNLNVNAPANDEPCGALNITSAGQTSLNTFGLFADMNCNNATASNENANYFNVPFTCGDNGFSMWYTFTTPLCGVNGTVPFIIEVSTNNPGTNFDTRLAVFQSDDNTCSGNLIQVACNDNNSNSAFQFLCLNSSNPNVSAIEMTNLLPNTQYWIYVDGANAATGVFELSGRVVAYHNAIASNNGTSITLTTDDRGAGLYTYYYQQVGSSGYSVTNSNELTDTRVLSPGATYNTQVMYRCGTNTQQSQFYRSQPEGVILVSQCPVVNDMTCTFNGPNSYTLTWTQPAGELFTNNGQLSGYRVKRNPIGSTSVFTFGNPAVVCSNGVCSVTLPGASPTGFNWTIETRCSATNIQVGNTSSCAPQNPGFSGNSNNLSSLANKSMQRTFSFVNAQAGIEFVDVQMYDAYADFGLNTPMMGDYEIFVNDNNEISWRRMDTPVDANFDFVIVPNPSNAMTTVFLNTIVEEGSFTIVDAMGRTIQTGSINNTDNVNFDSAQLPSGVYLVVVTIGNQKMTRRLVVAD